MTSSIRLANHPYSQSFSAQIFRVDRGEVSVLTSERQVVSIWSIALAQADSIVTRLRALLNAEEQARAQRFYFERDQRRYTVGRAMLRLILSQHGAGDPAALTFTYNQWGKPALATTRAPLAFNLTHTGDHALCAVTAGATVGIDLEEIRALDYQQMAATVFSPLEQSTLQQIAPAQLPLAFFNGWTRKEAYIKAHGQGLSMPLADFDVTLAPDEPARLLATRPDPTEATRWSLYGWSVGKSQVAALALAGHGWQLCHQDGAALL